ncbi:hypothetical protein DFA_08436 [Cavenderia fasciculata]|uniref:Uncharacterized protein n=1 Tax=Cavenderia fasciculata TaxID=261658 RepID=F4Q667_CACFS|nr:uncharacterized protein DFA_08436 [Cavenderia fasciculata]EGG17441.1 hypothetical protein DFA_08436 [Cavenderia fasciculata]|eukprot:XP_004355925.1 hypothetical protein DFA_08436 [Cavenderia fasciculata]
MFVVDLLIGFKGVEAINTDREEESKQFIATARTRFNLTSFKDIYENSISDHQVILGNQDDYPQWIQQRIYCADNNRADKSGITTVMATDDYPLPSLETLYDIPSIETLLLMNQFVVDLGSISRLPNLQHLSVSANKLNLGPHPTLKRHFHHEIHSYH